MNYERINFKNGENGGTPINDTNLNKMDKGIADLYEERLGTVLYEDSEGSNDDITLNDNVSNYEYVEIYFRNNDYVRSYIKIKIEERDTVANLVAYTIYQGVMLIKTRLIQIGSNNVSTYNNATLNVEINNTSGTHICTTDSSNLIFITKVVGQKKRRVTE